MDKTVSLVKVDTRKYRVIAKEHWGLTDEQMEGMHVHHRINRCDGGTNDPSNLYVCSPSFHSWAWHDGKEFIKFASEGGKLSVVKMNAHPNTASNRVENGRKTKNLRHSENHQRKAGSNQPREVRVENGKKGSSTTNRQRWMSIDPGFPQHISTPMGLSNWQKARGIDTSLRVKVGFPEPPG